MSNKIKPVNNSSVDWAESHEALAPVEELLKLMAAGKEEGGTLVGRWMSTGSLFMLMQEALIGLNGLLKKKKEEKDTMMEGHVLGGGVQRE